MKELSFGTMWAIGFEFLGFALPIILAVTLCVAVAVVALLLRFGAWLNARDWLQAALVGAVSGVAGLLLSLWLTGAAVTDIQAPSDILASAMLVLGLGIGMAALAAGISGWRKARVAPTV